MDQDKLKIEELTTIWGHFHKKAGWLNLISKIYTLTREETVFLTVLDSLYLKTAEKCQKEYQATHLSKSGQAIEELESETYLEHPELKESRADFLRQEIERFDVEEQELLEKSIESIEADRPWFLRKAVEELTNERLAKRRSYIRSCRMELRLLENPEAVKLNRLQPMEIAKAAAFPFDELLTFNRAGFAICPFHSEQKASLYWYKKDNRVHCFGCQWHGDPINFIQARDKVDFVKAVKSLL